MITTFLFDLGGVFFEADWEAANKQLYEKTKVYAFPQDGSKYSFWWLVQFRTKHASLHIF